jgi:hypothetical protein
MLSFVNVKLKEIFDQGKSYKWKKPKMCGNCRSTRLWGHGFVLAFFDVFDEGIYLRRYRCPCCGCVIRMKPMGYLRGFQTAINTIRDDLFCRIKTGKWPAGSSGQRGRHWLAALKKNIRLYLGDRFYDLINGFEKLMSQGRTPITRSV